MYDKKNIAIVVNLNNKSIPSFKRSIVNFIQQVESDDCLYFHDVKKKVFVERSQVLARIANCNFEKEPRLSDLVRDALEALNQEEGLKYLYLISDRKISETYQINKLVRIAGQIDCKVICFEAGRYEKLVESHIETSLDELNVNLIKFYRYG